MKSTWFISETMQANFHNIASCKYFIMQWLSFPNISSSQAQNCLTNLYKLDKVQFRQTMREYVNKDSLNNIVDFLHALLGFCMEPITDSKYVVCVWVGPDVYNDAQKIFICADGKSHK